MYPGGADNHEEDTNASGITNDNVMAAYGARNAYLQRIAAIDAANAGAFYTSTNPFLQAHQAAAQVRAIQQAEALDRYALRQQQAQVIAYQQQQHRQQASQLLQEQHQQQHGAESASGDVNISNDNDGEYVSTVDDNNIDGEEYADAVEEDVTINSPILMAARQQQNLATVAAATTPAAAGIYPYQTAAIYDPSVATRLTALANTGTYNVAGTTLSPTALLELQRSRLGKTQPKSNNIAKKRKQQPESPSERINRSKSTAPDHNQIITIDSSDDEGAGIATPEEAAKLSGAERRQPISTINHRNHQSTTTRKSIENNITKSLAGPFTQRYIRDDGAPADDTDLQVHQISSKIIYMATKKDAALNSTDHSKSIRVTFDRIEEIASEIVSDRSRAISTAVRTAFTECQSRHDSLLSQAIDKHKSVNRSTAAPDPTMEAALIKEKKSNVKTIKALQAEIKNIKEKHSTEVDSMKSKYKKLQEQMAEERKNHQRSLNAYKRASINSLRLLRKSQCI